ncbi:MAG TPA: hypothetical protein VFN48_00360 [Solirubrobacteraceae bacterium]|nr:hypothetical protein [Solirubrobacteraceae bacterium]
MPRPALARVLCPLGGLVLALSLTLSWSHQVNTALRARLPAAALSGVPADPSAFQVYAISGELLLLLAIGVAAAGLWGQRRGRAATLAGVGLAAAFTLHAVAVPPTDGVLFAAGPGRYLPVHAGAGPGQTVALFGLGLAAMGLLFGLAPVGRAAPLNAPSGAGRAGAYAGEHARRLR